MEYGDRNQVRAFAATPASDLYREGRLRALLDGVRKGVEDEARDDNGRWTSGGGSEGEEKPVGERSGTRMMSAKFPGKCADCGRQIAAGEKIGYDGKAHCENDVRVRDKLAASVENEPHGTLAILPADADKGIEPVKVNIASTDDPEKAVMDALPKDGFTDDYHRKELADAIMEGVDNAKTSQIDMRDMRKPKPTRIFGTAMTINRPTRPQRRVQFAMSWKP